MDLKRVTRWGRSDQAVLESCLWVAPVVQLAVLGQHAVTAVRGGALRISAELADGVLPTAAGLEGPVTATVVLDDATWPQHLLALVPDALLAALVITASVLLLGVVRALRDGDPFTMASARRLRSLAGLAIVGGAVYAFVEATVHGRLLADTRPDQVALVLELPLLPVVAGLLLGFLAEVFTRGAALRDDVDGLV